MYLSGLHVPGHHVSDGRHLSIRMEGTGNALQWFQFPPSSVCRHQHSQHTLGEETNPRGEVIENFIFSHSLVVENMGCVPTFSARGADTCIDVTLLLNLPSSPERRRVSDEATLPDHKCISFCLGLCLNSYTEAVPNLAKANWDKF